MFDDDLPKKKIPREFPRNLVDMSVTELEDYIVELQLEINLAQLDIEKKKASHSAADSFFK